MVHIDPELDARGQHGTGTPNLAQEGNTGPGRFGSSELWGLRDQVMPPDQSADDRGQAHALLHP
jgi:hypothetical protein